jgi:glutamate formiminotransferase
LKKIVECVPNFSEGRDQSVIHAIANAIAAEPGVAVLDVTNDFDHNRSVITFAGSPDRIGSAAIRAVEKAVELIDITVQKGVHPRIGAADVVPFVPIRGVSLLDCAGIAQETGEEIWRRLRVPVYLYEAAARRPDRIQLENIRRGKLGESSAPDIGGPELHPTAGATVVGARKLLIAYNVNLRTLDVRIAREIAAKIRTSSGGLPCVKALGLFLESRGQAQVSMNLTDFEITPMHKVFEIIREEAALRGVEVAGSEVIGLLPKRALEMAAGALLQIENFRPELILEDRIQHAFGDSPEQFLDKLADPASGVGCGSAAAFAAAMAASTGAAIARLLSRSDVSFIELRDRFTLLAKRDEVAYRDLIRMPVPSQETVECAALVPIEIAEAAAELKIALDEFQRDAGAQYGCDFETALSLASAACLSSKAIARANLSLLNSPEALADRLSAIE